MSAPSRLPDRPSPPHQKPLPRPRPPQPKEDLPATEKPESTENAVQADDSPEASDTAAPPPDPAEARENAEPRSRQEHADQPPADEAPGAVDAGAEDRNDSHYNGTPPTTFLAARMSRAKPTDDEIEIAFARANPTRTRNTARSAISRRRGEPTDPRTRAPRSDRIRKTPTSDDTKDPDQPVKHGLCRTTMHLPTTTNPPANRPGMGRTCHRSPRQPRQWPREGLILSACTQLMGGEIWSEERERLHDSIIEDIYAKAADVPCDFKAHHSWRTGGSRQDNGSDSTRRY